MRMQLKIGRYVVFYGPFNRVYIFARGDACSVADPEDMRIDRLCRLPPPHV